MTAAKRGFIPAWAASSSHPPFSQLPQLPDTLLLSPLSRAERAFPAQRCSWCLDNLLWAGCGWHRLTQQLICSCPCDISLFADVARQELVLHAAAAHSCPLSIWDFLREGSATKAKPRWVRPPLALTVFVSYRTAKQERGEISSAKVMLVLGCRTGSATGLMKYGTFFKNLILLW